MPLYQTLLIAGAIGMTAGILSGILGIGGGIIMIPALIYFFGFTQHQAQGTTLAAMVLPIGFLAAYEYYKKGHVDLKIALVIALCFFVGGFFGSKIVMHVDDKTLKKLFAVLMIFVSLRMLLA